MNMERVLLYTTNVPMPNENGWGRHMESQQVFCPTRMLPFSNLLSENHLLYNGKSGIRFFADESHPVILSVDSSAEQQAIQKHYYCLTNWIYFWLSSYYMALETCHFTPYDS